MNVFRKSTLALAIGSASLMSTASIAQTGSQPQLEEVLVTAQKREESLQETPISIAAFGGDELDRFAIDDLGDITARTPNVDITPFPNSRSSLVIFMRGVGNNDSQTTQDPAVGVYLDGVYVGRSVGLTSEVADLERIEVLRGPQGTLYGRNTTGGAINLITAKPSGEAGLKQLLRRGNRGHWKTQTQIETDTYAGVAAKLSYARSSHDGLVENTGPGDNNFSQEDKRAWRFATRWDVSDTLSVDYAYDDSEIVGPQAFYQFLRPAAFGGSESRQGKGSWSIPVEDSETEIKGHNLTVTWDLPLGTFKSISGYRELEESIIIDYGAGIPNFFDVAAQIDHRQLSQEFQLVGDIGSDFRYVTGLYYFEENGREREVDNGGGFQIENRVIDSTNKAWAAYGQLTWIPASLRNLELTLGLRYTEDEREAEKDFNANALRPTPFTVQGDEDWSNFSPSLTAEYLWSDNLSTYAKVVTAYKAGGFNVRSTDTGFLPPFDEEEMISYELGMKSTWWNNRIRLNVAAFQSEYTDMQIQQITDNTKIFLTDVFNAGEAEIDGFEIDLTAVLTEGLTATVAYGYTNAEFTEVIDNNPASATFGQDVSSTYTMPYAPEHTYSVVLDYVVGNFDFGVLRATVDYNWRDERFGTANNPDMQGFFLDDYGLVGARLSLSEIPFQKANMTVALWGKNLDNKEYVVHSISQGPSGVPGDPFINSAYFGELRSYGLDLVIEL